VKLSTIFGDIINVLHETGEAASAAHDISVVFEDLDGFRITRKEDYNEMYFFCRICQKTYSKMDVLSNRFCKISDLKASWKALGMEIDIPYLFACHCGFSNFLIPIKIGGSVAGNVFGGQFVIDRGPERAVSNRWLDECITLIKREWKIPQAIEGQYLTAAIGFLEGQERGGFRSIDEFLENVNNSAESAQQDSVVIEREFYDDVKNAIYGLDRESEVRRLISEVFPRPKILIQKFESLLEGGGGCPDPEDREDISGFLNRLKPDIAEPVEKTGIMSPDLRDDFIRKYRERAAFYNQSRNFRAKPLPTVIKIIKKLYSEAQILSQLGNERLYLNLYEGLTSAIPPTIKNKCKTEMRWIDSKMRRILATIDARKDKKTIQISKDEGFEIQQMNENFFAVLSQFQEYQHKYSRSLWRRLKDFCRVTRTLAISNFFNKYLNCLAWSRFIGTQIDRCERIYISVILNLQPLRGQKAELDDQLQELNEERRQKEHELADSDGEARLRIEGELEIIHKRVSEKETEIENKEKIIQEIEIANNKFLEACHECKKSSEQFEKELEKLRELYEIDFALSSFKEPQTQSMGKLLSFAGEYTRTLSSVLSELKYKRDIMLTSLNVLEAVDREKRYQDSVLDDKHSIAAICLKDRFIKGMLWVNEQTSKLLGMSHKTDFHIRYDTMYFNAGGLAPVHTTIERAQEKWLILRDESGAVSEETERRIERELRITRKYISLLLGVEKEEIVLTDSTTEGLALVLQAIQFEEGDQILTSNAEHDVVRYLVSNLIEKYHKFFGINLCWNPQGYDPKDIHLNVTRKTRLVLLSDIVFTRGDRLAIKEIIQKCREKFTEEVENDRNKPRSSKILFLIDGAQSAGQIPLDLKEMDCDFFAMDGHKWLLASEGSGALYVRKCFLEGIDPSVHFTFIKNYMVVDWDAGFHPKDKFGRSYELATINLPSKIGLRTAVQIIAIDGLAKMLGAPSRLDEEATDCLYSVLDSCFDRHGITRNLDAAIPQSKVNYASDKIELPKLIDVKLLNGELQLKAKDTEGTEFFLKECLDQGIRDIRDIITSLKDYLRAKLLRLRDELIKDQSSKITVQIVTREGNEGGVVGFQLVDKEKNEVLDAENGETQHKHRIHEELGKHLQKRYGIIFRVIPPPYPPAIRVCLHKFNTRSEIDIMYQALRETLPVFGAQQTCEPSVLKSEKISGVGYAKK
jgi:L-cysteine/cystine lyase